MQGFDQADRPEASIPAEKIDARKTAFHENGVENAVMAEYLLKSERTDERGKDHRNHSRKVGHALTGKIVRVVQERHRQGDQEDQQRGDDGDLEGIQQSFQIDEVGKDFPDQRGIQPLRHDRVDRQKQEEKQKSGDQNGKEVTEQFHFTDPFFRASSAALR